MRFQNGFGPNVQTLDPRKGQNLAEYKVEFDAISKLSSEFLIQIFQSFKTIFISNENP